MQQVLTPWPRLLADVGGTNARFALETSRFVFEAIDVLPCDGYPGLAAAARAYLDSVRDRVPGVDALRHAAIAIATPVEGDRVTMTNRAWSFSIESLRSELGLATLAVANDFAALAMALPHLGPANKVQIGDGQAKDGAPVVVLGPGTGLGVAALVPAGEGWRVLATEGGHVSFAPNDELETTLLLELRKEFKHVSAERLLSGPGLEFIHRIVSDGQCRSAADITRAALDGSCSDCARTVDTFCGILGSVAGNVALTLGAAGGVYIGGGIVPRLDSLFATSSFRARFMDKGRLSAYVARIPTYLIIAPYPAFFGTSDMITRRLAAEEEACRSVEHI